MISEQIIDYCNCIDDVTDKDIEEMLELVSQMTCWGDTFLTSQRREVIDVEPRQGIYEFEPFYHPYDIDTFTFTLVEQNGLEEEKTDVEYVYSDTDECFKMDFGFGCNSGCGSPKYKLVVTYNAGYDEIPDFLLPVFCNILNVIKAKNTCDCEKDCGCDENNVQYAKGDVVTVALETKIGEILQNQYLKELSRISLCEKNNIWGLVV